LTLCEGESVCVRVSGKKNGREGETGREKEGKCVCICG